MQRSRDRSGRRRTGLTPDQLRSRARVRVLRGGYAYAPVAERAEVRGAALSPVTRSGDVVSGRTAAWVYGVWRPAPGQVVPLEVSRPVRVHGMPAGGVSRRRLVLRDPRAPARSPSVPPHLDADVVRRGTLAVTSPMRTCFDLMRERQLVEAVVVADAFAHAGQVALPLLDAYVADRRRWPAVRLARAAVDLASAGAMSPGETRLRMVVVLSGLGEPLVNVPVMDARGRHVGTPDLRVLGRRRHARLEYDGGYHETVEQHGRDLRRENNLLAGSSVPVLRYDRRHVRSGRELIVQEVARVTGLRPLLALDPEHFRRPPQPLAW